MSYSKKKRQLQEEKEASRVKLAGIAAALINEHTHIATASAGALWQIRNRVLYPLSNKQHERLKAIKATLHTILLGVGGSIYTFNTLHQLKVR